MKHLKLKEKINIKAGRNLCIFALLIIFTFWYLFKDQDINELLKVISQVDIKYVILAFLVMFGAHLMESLNVRSFLMALGEKKISIFRAFKYTAIGNFFSAITPAASGGQPVEIYYMSKDGIKPTNSMLAMLIELCGFQISTIFLSIVCGIINHHLLEGGFTYVYILGLVLNGTVLTIMLLGIFPKKQLKK